MWCMVMLTSVPCLVRSLNCSFIQHSGVNCYLFTVLEHILRENILVNRIHFLSGIFMPVVILFYFHALMFLSELKKEIYTIEDQIRSQRNSIQIEDAIIKDINKNNNPDDVDHASLCIEETLAVNATKI